MKTINLLLTLIIGVVVSCGHEPRAETNFAKTQTVFIQPLGNIDTATVHFVAEGLSKIVPVLEIKNSIPLPQQAFYKSRNRYRADSIIQYLASITSGNDITLGLTIQDISTTKGNVKDWGVMGLGCCPGKACVASSFRLGKDSKKSQLFKVSIHELGHTMGLPHCPEKTCYMRDAEGGNPTGEEHEFCNKCKTYLQDKGWKLK